MPKEIKLLVVLLVALTLIGLASRKAQAAPLDEALHLVVQESVVVQAAHENALEVSKQSDWAARVRLAYQMEGTDADSEGLNMGAYLEIPLFSRKGRLAETEARYKAADTEYKIREKFLADVAKITTLNAELNEAKHMRQYYKDRLQYYKEAEENGLIDPGKLWPEAKQAQTAHFKMTKLTTKLSASIEEIARTYGGRRWQRLQLLLAAHAKQNSQ
jgi:hypothetical protein